MARIEKIDELEINKNKIPKQDVSSDSIIYMKKEYPKVRIFNRFIVTLSSICFLISVSLFVLSTISSDGFYYRYGNIFLIFCIMGRVIHSLMTMNDYKDIVYIISDNYIIKTSTNENENNSELVDIDDIKSADFSKENIIIDSESEDIIIENPSKEMIKDIQDVLYFNK